MLGRLRETLARLWTRALGDVPTAKRAKADGGTTGRTDAGTDPGLFECRSCGKVFVATDKPECSDCETTLERVPATLAEAKDHSPSEPERTEPSPPDDSSDADEL